MVIDVVLVLIVQLDKDYCYWFVNKVFLDWYGFSFVELLGWLVWDVSGIFVFEYVLFSLEWVLQGECICFQVELNYCSGEL